MYMYMQMYVYVCNVIESNLCCTVSCNVTVHFCLNPLEPGAICIHLLHRHCTLIALTSGADLPAVLHQPSMENGKTDLPSGVIKHGWLENPL